MSLISVIVPVYKVEPYLNKCIESIVNQTYKNLEIILVNDGSPDNCPAICDSWAEKDARIKVIHKENGGLSDARNSGLKSAAGDYIAFVDSDDWVHELFIERLYDAIIKNEAQLVACEVAFVSDDTENLGSVTTNDAKNCTAEEALTTLQNGNGFRATAWNKLYKKTLLLNEHFKVGCYHEDEFFTYRIVSKAEQLAYIEDPLYFYRQRSGSIMASNDIRHLDSLDAYRERMTFFEQNYPMLVKKDKLIICIACVQLYKSFLKVKKEERKIIKQRILDVRRSVRFSVRELLTYSIHDMIYILCSKFCLGLFCRVLLRKANEDV